MAGNLYIVTTIKLKFNFWAVNFLRKFVINSCNICMNRGGINSFDL